MDSRRRFLQCMSYGAVDRIPLLEEPIREETVELWRCQGLSDAVECQKDFRLDIHEVIEPNLEALPPPATWPSSRSELDAFREYLNPHDPARLYDDWPARVTSWRSHNHVLILRVQHGFFLSMGVDGWERFMDVMRFLTDDPAYVIEMMELQGEFSARIAEKVLSEVEVEAAMFVEPIAGNHGPLISPRMYEELVLRGYDRILSVLKKRGIETIILRSFANIRPLLPGLMRRGFNCLWACEAGSAMMDYRALRREFGRDLRLIGGIDLDALRAGKDDIRREILEKVPPLLADGGYIPAADGRIREDVPYENYACYRRLLHQVAGG